MFENFVTFTEVIKLSTSAFYNLSKINQISTRILKRVFQIDDYKSAEQMYDLSDDKTIFREFIFCDQKHFYASHLWSKFIARVITNVPKDFKDSFEWKNVTYTRIFHCVFAEDIDLLKYIIDNNFNEENDHRTYTRKFMFRDRTKSEVSYHILFEACKVNSQEVVKFIFPSFDIRDINDAVKFALENHNYEIAKYLIENGIDPSSVPDEILYEIVNEKREDILVYLIDNGTKIPTYLLRKMVDNRMEESTLKVIKNMESVSVQYLLHVVRNGNLKIITTLLEIGVKTKSPYYKALRASLKCENTYIFFEILELTRLSKNSIRRLIRLCHEYKNYEVLRHLAKLKKDNI